MEDPDRLAGGHYPDLAAAGSHAQASSWFQPVRLPQHTFGTTEPNFTAAPTRRGAERLPPGTERPRVLLERVKGVSQRGHQVMRQLDPIGTCGKPTRRSRPPWDGWLRVVRSAGFRERNRSQIDPEADDCKLRGVSAEADLGEDSGDLSALPIEIIRPPKFGGDSRDAAHRLRHRDSGRERQQGQQVRGRFDEHAQVEPPGGRDPGSAEASPPVRLGFRDQHAPGTANLFSVESHRFREFVRGGSAPPDAHQRSRLRSAGVKNRFPPPFGWYARTTGFDGRFRNYGSGLGCSGRQRAVRSRRAE